MTVEQLKSLIITNWYRRDIVLNIDDQYELLDDLKKSFNKKYIEGLEDGKSIKLLFT